MSDCLYFVFFKQKTAYEMRISDWSSDVCSSDLYDLPIVGDVRGNGFFYGIELVKDKATKESFNDEETERVLYGFLSKKLFENGLYESDKRRVGKEYVSTCRSGWSP